MATITPPPPPARNSSPSSRNQTPRFSSNAAKPGFLQSKSMPSPPKMPPRRRSKIEQKRGSFTSSRSPPPPIPQRAKKSELDRWNNDESGETQPGTPNGKPKKPFTIPGNPKNFWPKNLVQAIQNRNKDRVVSTMPKRTRPTPPPLKIETSPRGRQRSASTSIGNHSIDNREGNLNPENDGFINVVTRKASKSYSASPSSGSGFIMPPAPPPSRMTSPLASPSPNTTRQSSTPTQNEKLKGSAIASPIESERNNDISEHEGDDDENQNEEWKHGPQHLAQDKRVSQQTDDAIGGEVNIEKISEQSKSKAEFTKPEIRRERRKPPPFTPKRSRSQLKQRNPNDTVWAEHSESSTPDNCTENSNSPSITITYTAPPDSSKFAIDTPLQDSKTQFKQPISETKRTSGRASSRNPKMGKLPPRRKLPHRTTPSTDFSWVPQLVQKTKHLQGMNPRRLGRIWFADELKTVRHRKAQLEELMKSLNSYEKALKFKLRPPKPKSPAPTPPPSPRHSGVFGFGNDHFQNVTSSAEATRWSPQIGGFSPALSDQDASSQLNPMVMQNSANTWPPLPPPGQPTSRSIETTENTSEGRPPLPPGRPRSAESSQAQRPPFPPGPPRSARIENSQQGDELENRNEFVAAPPLTPKNTTEGGNSEGKTPDWSPARLLVHARNGVSNPNLLKNPRGQFESRSISPRRKPRRFRPIKNARNFLNWARKIVAGDGKSTTKKGRWDARVRRKSSLVFRRSLEDLVMQQDVSLSIGIPKIVIYTVDAIWRRGLKIEGIFRKSGNSEKISEVAHKLESGSDIDWDNTDIHVIAGVLKKFLRNLSEPLIPYDLYDPVISMDKRKKTIEIFDYVVTHLPEIHWRTFRLVFMLLKEIARHSEENKMTERNLAIVFAPNILKKREETTQAFIQDMKSQHRAVTSLIKNFDASTEAEEVYHKLRSAAASPSNAAYEGVSFFPGSYKTL